MACLQYYLSERFLFFRHWKVGMSFHGIHRACPVQYVATISNKLEAVVHEAGE
jgi:hypothetical protein